MAKRDTGVGSKIVSHPHKTKKRLAAKRAMLVAKAGNNQRHNRPIPSVAH